jgi:hypothetical protein
MLNIPLVAQDLALRLTAYNGKDGGYSQRCSGTGGAAPLFSSLLNYRYNIVDLEAELSSIPGVDFLGSRDRTNYPLAMSVDDYGEGFTLSAQADRDVDPHRIIAYVRTAVGSIVDALENSREALHRSGSGITR